MTHFIIQSFYFVEEGLGTESLHIILLEVDALMVQGLEVVLFILLPPDFVEALQYT
jgi:hypothetical protein